MQIYTPIENIRPQIVPPWKAASGCQELPQGVDPREQEPHLKDNRRFIEKEIAFLMELRKELKILAPLHTTYSQSPTKELSGKITEAIKRVRELFEKSIYRHGDFGFNEYSPLYNFIIQTGKHMDHQEYVHFGTENRWSEKNDMISLGALKLAGIFPDQIEIPETLNFEDNLKAIDREIVKLEAFLWRLNFIDHHNRITLNPGWNWSQTKWQLLTHSPGELEKELLKGTAEYMNLSITLLEKIKTKAREHLEAPQKEESFMTVQIYMDQIIDEINRMASHAQFNGMNLLTGRYALDDPFIRFDVTEQSGKLNRVLIPTMTTHALLKDIFEVKDWYPHIEKGFATDKNIQKIVKGVDAKVSELKKTAEKMKAAASRVQTENANPDRENNRLFHQARKELETISEKKIPQKEHPAIPEINDIRELLLFYSAIEGNYKKIYTALQEMRQQAVMVINSVYDEEEKNIFNGRFQSLSEDINRWAKEVSYRGEPILEEKWKAIFNPEEKKSEPAMSLYPIKEGFVELFNIIPFTLKELGLTDWDGDTPLKINNSNNANRALGYLDNAVRILSLNRHLLISNVMLLLTAEEKENIIEKFQGDLLKDRNKAKVHKERFIRTFLTLSKKMLAQMRYFLELGTRSVYTYENRFLMKQMANSLALNGTRFLKEARELIDEVGKAPLPDELEEKFMAAIKWWNQTTEDVSKLQPLYSWTSFYKQISRKVSW